MRVRIATALLMIAATGLASCGQGGDPKGQVAAKVGKQEITMIDLQSEIKGASFPSTEARLAAERQVLQGLIQRRVIADAAIKEKLDKTPEFARQMDRAREVILIQALQNKLAASVPPPNADEVRAFVTEHPETYSARRLFQTETVRFTITDPAIIEALRPLNTMPEVTALLRARNIPFQTGSETLDALAFDPTITTQLLKLPADDVFVVPQGQNILVGHIQRIDTSPVPDAVALRHANAYLKMSRTREAIAKRMQMEMFKAKADIKYNKLYDPAAKTPAAKPAAKAAPTPAP